MAPCLLWGGAYYFPYGNGYAPKKCVGVDFNETPGPDAGDVPLPFGATPDCHGTALPLDQVYNLSGNVFEWEDSCDAVTGAADKCHRRGGAYTSGQSELKCTDTSYSTRETRTQAIGFRCCYP